MHHLLWIVPLLILVYYLYQGSQGVGPLAGLFGMAS